MSVKKITCEERHSLVGSEPVSMRTPRFEISDLGLELIDLAHYSFRPVSSMLRVLAANFFSSSSVISGNA